MHKILLIIISIALTTTNVFANITEGQIKEYLNSSIAEIILKSSQDKMVKFLYAVYGIEDKKFYDDNTTNIFKEYLNNPSNILLFTNRFKNYTENEYNTIIKFYSSKIGNKYAEAYKLIVGYDNQSDIKKKYTELHKNYTFSQEKLKLIDSIGKALNQSESELNYAKKIAYQHNNNLPKNKQYTEEEMQKLKLKYVSKYIAYKKVINGIIYYDFNEKELLEILKFSLTDAAKKEVKYINEALGQYNQHILKEISILKTALLKEKD